MLHLSIVFFSHLSLCHLTCRQSSLTASHTQNQKVLTCIFMIVQHLSWSYPVSTLLFHFPSHYDTCSAAEIKGSALISSSTKCRPAAQGSKQPGGGGLITNCTKWSTDNRQRTLPSLVKPQQHFLPCSLL